MPAADVTVGQVDGVVDGQTNDEREIDRFHNAEGPAEERDEPDDGQGDETDG